MTQLKAVIDLDTGGDLIAAIPRLVGHHPADSLVLVTVARGPDGLTTGPVFRLTVENDRVDEDVAHMAAMSARDGVLYAYVVMIGGHRLAHRQLVAKVRDAFGVKDIEVKHALWTRRVQMGEAWWCYHHPGCGGFVPDPDASALAATFAVEGRVVYESREEVEASLAADPPDQLERRSVRLDALIAAENSADAEAAVDAAFTRDIAEVQHAMDDFANQSIVDVRWDEDRVVNLAFALTHSDVRSECLKIALSDQADAAMRLWTWLTRSAPSPERAEPAFLVAIGAYLRGDGVLANIALEVALRANPDHQLAALFQAAIDRAITPLELRDILIQAAARDRKAS